ncbi:unnamed protein product, partial [Polarella glacialis]
ASASDAAAEAAMRHFGHVHPRVRWAALEVWARLLSMHIMAPIKFFEQASEALFAAAGADTYNRVRQRGLLVLMLLTGLDAAA